jgi:5-(carboxyamino)imidazole ribonucleotide synthase
MQLLRVLLDLPLGSTTLTSPGVMLNLLGEPGFIGTTKYEGVNEALAMEGVNLHFYGKKQTKPFRKMGHATVVDKDLEAAKVKARKVQEVLKVKC